MRTHEGLISDGRKKERRGDMPWEEKNILIPAEGKTARIAELGIGSATL